MSKPPERVQKKSPSLPEAVKSDDLAQEISKRISSLVSEGQRAQVVAQVVSVVSEERFSGPIAHPRHLREYELICPGAADRIINMAEGNLNHSQNMQMAALQGDIADTKAGRLYGFLALLAIIGAALISTYLGYQVLAAAFLGAGVLGVIGKFIQGRDKSSEG